MVAAGFDDMHHIDRLIFILSDHVYFGIYRIGTCTHSHQLFQHSSCEHAKQYNVTNYRWVTGMALCI